MITGIVVALPEELGTLISGKVEKGNVAALTDNILVAYAGAGYANARNAAATLIGQGAGQLISWGCAAALSPELAPGNLIIADRLLANDKPAIAADQAWLEHARSLLKGQLTVHTGHLFSSLTLVTDRRQKQDLYQRTLALGLDMESHAIAACAAKAGIPYLTLRAIADPADMSLPRAVSQSLNSAGEIELNKLIGHLLLHPLQLPALIKLGSHFAAAKKSLKLIRKDLDKITEFNARNTKD